MFAACHAYLGSVVRARRLGGKKGSGQVVQYAHLLTGKISAIHLVDSDGSLQDNDTSTHAPLGTGRIELRQGRARPILEAGTTMSHGR